MNLLPRDQDPLINRHQRKMLPAHQSHDNTTHQDVMFDIAMFYSWIQREPVIVSARRNDYSMVSSITPFCGMRPKESDTAKSYHSQIQ